MRSFLTRTLALSLVGTAAIAPSAFSFDLEDYATTYRATRDAYLKADNELKLAIGIFARSRMAAQLVGFDLAAGEQYFWPISNYRPKVTDRTGQNCRDESGNPIDEACNVGATCDQDGKCTAGSALYGPATDWKKIIGAYLGYLSVKDSVVRTDNGLNSQNESNPNLDQLFTIETTAWWGGTQREYLFDGPFYELRWRAFTAYRIQIQTAEADLYPQPETSQYAGLIAPTNWETAQWVLDPEDPLDQEVIAWIAQRYKQTRDAMVKAAAELKLATGPYRAAQAAYQTATDVYIHSTACGGFGDYGLPSEWFCVAGSDGPVRCDCNHGPGQCDGNNAVIANEPVPAQSFELCPSTPSAEFPCLCVYDAAGTPCQSGTGTRLYE
jgi:hypothetical protein